MLALVLDGRPTLREDYPEPVRRPGECLVAVRLAGICDTDLALSHGYLDFRGVLGHELVGVVQAADDPRWLGRRVVADINAGCGDCPDCRDRDGHHCPTRTVLGIHGRDGALAERCCVPARCLVEVPDSLPDEAAVFAEPLAAALHVLDEPAIAASPRVIVLGDGKLGLLVALALLGAGKSVTVVGHHPEKLAIASQRGAVGVLAVDSATLPRAPVVVEATGSPSGLARAIELTAPRGTIVLKTTVSAPSPLPLARVVVDEISLVGSRCGDLSRAIHALTTGAVDPTPLVSARYPLTEADAALSRASSRDVLKVLVRVGGGGEAGALPVSPSSSSPPGRRP
jgi:threonine dehydrogenase-like Zn-dependent dehydrogenase